MGAGRSRELLEARIRELELELERLKAGDGARVADPARLTTVRVPAPFEAPFLRAQEYVERYFANRVEQPDTATISIAGERYVLLRAASLSVEFVELVMKLYADRGSEQARSVANNLLFDLAHALGKADARCFQEKMKVSEPIDTSRSPVGRSSTFRRSRGRRRTRIISCSMTIRSRSNRIRGVPRKRRATYRSAS